MTDFSTAKAAARPGVIGWRPLIDIPGGFVAGTPCNHVHKTAAAAEACARDYIERAITLQAECAHAQVISNGQVFVCRDCGFEVKLKGGKNAQ